MSWDCEDFEVCPFDDMLCHKCPYGRLSELQKQISDTLNEHNIAGSITADEAIEKMRLAYEDSLLDSEF